ncbi:hypothetical protein LWI28_019971 [Acer negundo]|uniref:Uncharacterized protein n=1 Tax=Acer negundo TaxID=4023 RepID=A0AAD5I7N1_ACENE|nr:hypothetical protein LWI28_019971 [Acer negundo]
MEQTNVPHVMFLPFPAQGHIKPMMKLAELLNQAGSQVTFVNTDHNHDRLMSHTDLTYFHDRSPNFLFRSIPDGLRPDKARSASNFIEFLDTLQAVAKPAFRQLLISTGMRPTCIIADGIMSFAAIDVAEELGIPVITFRTFNASCTWTYFHLSKLVEAGEVPFPDENFDKSITCIPGYENVFRSRDLPGICRVENPGYSFLDFFIREASTMTRASALILNTFHELEAPVISRLNSIFTKIYTIGPLHALYKSRTKDLMISQSDSSNGVRLWKEDRSCMTWLDSQPLRSVIYVSFGSLVNLTRLQTLEFLHGTRRGRKHRIRRRRTCLEGNRGATGRVSSSSAQISVAATKINVMVRLWMAEIGLRKTRQVRRRRTLDSLLLDWSISLGCLAC